MLSAFACGQVADPAESSLLPDAGDGGSEGIDGGIKDIDGGPKDIDGGPKDIDGGPKDIDGGPKDIDGGIEGVDAGLDAGDGGIEGIDGGIDAGDGGASGTDAGVTARCPAEMALVPGMSVCIDRYEGALLEELPDGGERRFSPYENPGTAIVRAEASAGRQPQGYISGAQATAACVRAGKRLCALAEWMAACQGTQKRTYPYGNSYLAHACNEGRTPHPVVQFYGTSVGVWDSLHMNDAGINQQANTVANSGAYSVCVTPEGVADLVGNVHEWVSDHSFKGGYYVDAKINGDGCLYRTTAHAFDYHDYSTGFRCCAAATLATADAR